MRKITFPRMYLFLLVLIIVVLGCIALNSFLNPKATSIAQFVPSIQYITVDQYSEQQINKTLHKFTFEQGFKITHATSTYIILER